MAKRSVFALALVLGFGLSAQAALLFNTNANWKYFKGRSEASTPDTTAWRRLDFSDSAFTDAPSPFWYGDVLPGGTQLTDMINQYTCIFMRRTCVIDDLSQVSGLRLGYHCDDGFIMWINGVEAFRYNMPAGNIPFNGVAGPAVTEPVQLVYADLTTATNYIVQGTNIVAVQAFNTAITSSDLGINISLASLAPDTVPPTIASKTPAPGTVNTLTQVTVVFSEPVGGVNASDLLVNGLPATSMSGGNDTYTFRFNQPAYGPVNISWAGSHGITDFGIPPNSFNASGPGATWQYNLVDNLPPTVSYQLPFAGVTVRSLSQIEVVFSEAVTGVNASDLLIDGSAAGSVTANSASDYTFHFAEPPPGTVSVQWASAHGITDLATVPNSFAGGSWTYTLDPNAVLTSVRINELLAANVTGLKDEDGQAQDWVELFNTSSGSVSLAGWSLTDNIDDPEKWVFPPVAIAPHEYLVVFCSGKDRKPTAPGTKLHTNFKLDPDGEYLALYNAEVPRQAVSVFNPYPNQRKDYSYGYDPVDQLKYFQVPTPGAANGASSITGIVSDTKFSHDRGFYETNFSLSITCATPAVTIRYTIDGTAPTATSGIVYSAPVPVSATTVLRAAAFKSGFLPSDVDCHTYIFLADVVNQSPTGAAPPGWPTTWGANVVDYGMDPDVIGPSGAYRTTIKDDLKAIPTLSVVMVLSDLFNASTGIYANPGQDGIDWERPCSLELIYPDDTEGFQANCGVRMRGGFSRDPSNPKHAFRIFFRQEYGPSKLAYPIFGPTGAEEFDKFDIRTMQNYSWAFQGDSRMICLRDVMSRDAQLAMGQQGTRGNFFHLYLNGQYWGLYNTEERPEASFAESYIGGDEKNYDVIKVEAGPYTINATDGNMDAWTRLWQAATNGFANDADYFRVQGLNADGTPNPAYENLLDVDNLIDYMLVILYGGNLDAPISNFIGNTNPNNWYGFRDRSGTNGGFRFISHDAEHTLLDVNANRIGPYDAGDPTKASQGGPAGALLRSNPQYIWTRLQANAEFRMRMADRVQKHCFNGGTLSVEGMRAMFLTRSNEIDRAIVGESARWGDAKVATPFTRSTWVSAMGTVLNSFIPGRTAVLLTQLRTANLFPTINAPIFSSRGGLVDDGFSLFLTNNNGSGTLYYTLDGSDPRQRGGNVSAAAVAYTAGTPITINFPTIVRARVRSGTTWSAITEGTFFTRQSFAKLIITEIMYHPPDNAPFLPDDVEFLEFKNVGTNLLDLTGIGFSTGINFSFTNKTRIAPGQFFVLGRNRSALQAKYPGLVVNGIYTGRLDNGGERLALTNALGATVFSVEYKDSGRWPLTPDGKGYSLVSREPDANPNPSNPTSWRASTNPGGSPGADDPASTIPAIVINEALTHSDPPTVDAIELYNPTGSSVDIGGWFLTDDPAIPGKFRIPNGTTISAGGFLVFTEADFNPTPGTNNSFSLSSSGEQVYLLSGDANTNLTGYSHGFNFDAAPSGVSFGRYVISTGDEHFVLQKANTLNAPNAGPLIGSVVIRQIMYHPPDFPGDVDNSQDEYIELRNRTTGVVQLYDPAAPTNTWRLRGGVDFNLPMNVSLGTTQSLLLVNFDPSDSAMVSAFRSKYGSFTGVPLYGPYSGKLDNSSDTVKIERPDPPDTNGVAYITVDEVDYKDAAPWPSAPDGSGAALQRLDLSAYGNDPVNWVGAAPLTIISVSPAYVSVKTGTNAVVTFTVNAFGTGDLKYQWQKDGNNIPGATNVSITIMNVQFEDDGLYTATVTDLSGSAPSPAAALRVLVPPVIVQPPLSQTVVAGARVTLSAVFTGNPPPFTNEWRLSSIPLSTNVTTERISFFTFTAPSIAATQQYRFVVKCASAPAVGVSHSQLATIIVLADSDGDGIPDVWETAYGFNPNAADSTLDSDGDGMTNLQEYIAGTNPNDASSYLKISGPELGSSVVLNFNAVSNRTYTVQFKDSLDAAIWTKLTDVPATSSNRAVSVSDPVPNPTRFYHLATPRQP